MARVDVVLPVDAAGNDDPDRRLLREHRPDLDRRRVRPEEQPVAPFAPVLHEERVDGVARRVVGREVQRLEVEPVGLDVGPVRDLVAEREERRLHATPHDRQRMQPPDARGARRERHVDGEGLLLLEAFEEKRRFFECGERSLGVFLQPVDGRADGSLVFLRKGSKALEQIRDDSLLLAQPFDVQRAHVGREEAARRDLLLRGLQLFEENSSLLFDGLEQRRHYPRVTRSPERPPAIRAPSWRTRRATQSPSGPRRRSRREPCGSRPSRPS